MGRWRGVRRLAGAERGLDLEPHGELPTFAVTLSLFRGPSIEELLFVGARLDVEEHPLVGAQHQGLAWD
jgi:hypothetical protein